MSLWLISTLACSSSHSNKAGFPIEAVQWIKFLAPAVQTRQKFRHVAKQNAFANESSTFVTAEWMMFAWVFDLHLTVQVLSKSVFASFAKYDIPFHYSIFTSCISRLKSTAELCDCKQQKCLLKFRYLDGTDGTHSIGNLLILWCGASYLKLTSPSQKWIDPFSCPNRPK